MAENDYRLKNELTLFCQIKFRRVLCERLCLEIKIRYGTTNEKSINIRMFNYLGEVSYNISYQLSVGENYINIPTDAMPSGIYIISIENNNVIYTDKIIINH